MAKQPHPQHCPPSSPNQACETAVFGNTVSQLSQPGMPSTPVQQKNPSIQPNKAGTTGTLSGVGIQFTGLRGGRGDLLAKGLTLSGYRGHAKTGRPKEATAVNRSNHEVTAGDRGV